VIAQLQAGLRDRGTNTDSGTDTQQEQDAATHLGSHHTATPTWLPARHNPAVEASRIHEHGAPQSFLFRFPGFYENSGLVRIDQSHPENAVHVFTRFCETCGIQAGLTDTQAASHALVEVFQ